MVEFLNRFVSNFLRTEQKKPKPSSEKESLLRFLGFDEKLFFLFFFFFFFFIYSPPLFFLFIRRKE